MNEDVTLLDLPIVPNEDNSISEIPHKAARHRGLPISLRLAMALLLSVATVFCKLGNPDSALQLQRWIIGDGSERVQQAFFSMERALDEGEAMSEAWTVFCQELTDETA